MADRPSILPDVARGPALERGAATADSSVPWWNRSLVIKAGLFTLITAAVIAGLAGWVGARDVLGLILGVGAGHLLGVTVLAMSMTVWHAWRFRTVLLAIGYDVSPRRAFHLTMAAWPISSITPAKSGDLVKAYYLRNEVPATATIGGLLAERAVDVAVWAVLSLVASLYFDRLAITAFSAAVVAGVLAFFALAHFSTRLPLKPALRDRIDLLFSSTHALWRRPRFLVLTVCLTVTNFVATVLVAAILYNAVGASVPLLYSVAALPPAMYAGLLPFTLGGMGTRDSMLILLFEGYATSAQSLSVGILYAFFLRWLLSLLGIPFLQRLIKDD